jgi:hypothetical protein
MLSTFYKKPLNINRKMGQNGENALGQKNELNVECLCGAANPLAAGDSP